MAHYLHIYCGNGKGKTTAAIGLAVRARGSGLRVLFVQFFKDGKSSEISPLKALGIDCMFAKNAFGRFASMDDQDRQSCRQMFDALLNDTISAAQEYDMVVLDEVVSAFNFHMIDQEKLLSFIQEGGRQVELVLTGRDPAQRLVGFADYVSEIKELKHPYTKGVAARRGIEF